MNERQFQGAVIDLCKLYGIAWYHTYDSRNSVPGWPDLALCGPGGFMLRELKTDRGELTSDQDEWGFMLRNAGVNWDVWRPGDLHSGRIERELMAISGPRLDLVVPPEPGKPCVRCGQLPRQPDGALCVRCDEKVDELVAALRP
jgi:hypothetical protein